jgi:beta-glucosidase
MLLKRFSSFTLFFSLAVAFLASADAQSSPFSAEAKQKAEALLKQMTLDEKIGQLNQSAGIVMPGIAEKKPDDLIIQGKVGSILWLNDVRERNRLRHFAIVAIRQQS